MISPRCRLMTVSSWMVVRVAAVVVTARLLMSGAGAARFAMDLWRLIEIRATRR